MRNLKLALLIFCSFLSLTCKKDPTKYELPIEREKLKRIILDIYLAGAATEMDSLTNKDSLKQIYLTEICLIHNVREEDLKAALIGLTDSYIINADIQRELLDSLNKLNLQSLSN